MAIKKNARIVATLIHHLDNLVLDRQKYPITITIKEKPLTADPLLSSLVECESEKNAMAAYFLCNGQEAYYIFEPQFQENESDLYLIYIVFHEVRHRVQLYYPKSISFSLWQKIKKIFCNKCFWSFFLLKGALWTAFRHRKNKAEADAYFMNYLVYAFFLEWKKKEHIRDILMF